MDIQFRCTSVSHFDEKAGQYQHCEQLLQASEENVGLKVRCPRCNQMTTVPSPAMASATVGSAEELDTAIKRETVAQVQSTLSWGKFNTRVRCPKCGSLLDEQKRCTACRYETPLVKASQEPIENMKVQPAGFQRWFQSIMADGIGIQVFEATIHSLFSVAILISLVAAIGMGGQNMVLILLGVLFLAMIYFLLVSHTKRLAHVPGARLPFYLKPFWNLLLYMARNQKWQKYDSTLKDRVIIDVRGENFGDRELLALENLNIAQVLDAEGTDITDNALAAMHGLKHLRCLVIRKTHVTHEAVFRLQQSLPKCWIWY